jgi:ATP-dependent Clp protease ATP-binding subunit ClpA
MQPERFTLKAQEALAAAQKSAQGRGHAQIEPEHVATVLLDQEGGLAVPIQKETQDQVALALLKGDFRDGDTIRVDERNLGLVFEKMEAAPEAAPPEEAAPPGI